MSGDHETVTGQGGAVLCVTCGRSSTSREELSEIDCGSGFRLDADTHEEHKELVRTMAENMGDSE